MQQTYRCNRLKVRKTPVFAYKLRRDMPLRRELDFPRRDQDRRSNSLKASLCQVSEATLPPHTITLVYYIPWTILRHTATVLICKKAWHACSKRRLLCSTVMLGLPNISTTRYLRVQSKRAVLLL